MFENKTNSGLFYKAGLSGSGKTHNLYPVFIALAICWLPVAIITLYHDSFWTGEVTTSFITDFAFQVRFFISMPIFILADKSINKRFSILISEFLHSGIINKGIESKFEEVIQSMVRILQSRWTDAAVLLLCYTQIFAVYYYESTNTSVLYWQLQNLKGEASLNFAGYWSIFISIPFVLFLVYRWILRIIIWWIILFRISRLDITLFPFHPDLNGGLGFLGFSLRYFSPIAFAFSAIVAGNIADFILIEGINLIDLRLPLIGYLVFIIVFFTAPLLFFSIKMQNESEKCVYENYDYANGIYRELRKKITKGYDQVTSDDLELNDYSATTDLSSVIDNALKMQLIPFKFRDLVPLLLMTVIPFLGVVLIEFPLNELLAAVFTLLK